MSAAEFIESRERGIEVDLVVHLGVADEITFYHHEANRPPLGDESLSDVAQAAHVTTAPRSLI